MEAQIESKELPPPLWMSWWETFESFSNTSVPSPPIKSVSFNGHSNEIITGHVLNKWKDAFPLLLKLGDDYMEVPYTILSTFVSVYYLPH